MNYDHRKSLERFGGAGRLKHSLMRVDILYREPETEMAVSVPF